MTLTVDQVRQKYLDFFTQKLNHQLIPAAPLVPLDDSTTLFTSSGMQQLVPYLKGQSHPQGSRLVNSQPCLRVQDIDEVGDSRHTTFFEMLGNWSLGDYFKKDQLKWFWQFLTEALKLPKEKLHITLFEGDQIVPKDEESFQIWQDLGVKKDHLHYYDATKNWWSRSGIPNQMPPGEIGGPDSEVFYDFGKDLNLHQQSQFKDQPCHVNCDCGRYLEIGNSVFIQYEKQSDGSFKSLPKKNVDFGGGLERLTMAANDQPDIFKIDIFQPFIKALEKETKKNYGENINTDRHFRIVSDHLRASSQLITEGVKPGNKAQQYVLRRLLRKALLHFRALRGMGFDENILAILSEEFKFTSKVDGKQWLSVTSAIEKEGEIFIKSLDKGLKELKKRWSNLAEKGKFIPNIEKAAKEAFYFHQSYGFPADIYIEEAKQAMKIFPWWHEGTYQEFIDKFDQFKKEHQDKSRTASKGMFKGGLAKHSEEITKLHTATHLLHQALREVLGDHVQQKGSNITNERLRFDFSHPQALTDQEIQSIESLINQQIKTDLPVTKAIKSKDAALKSGALAFFAQNYPDKVDVYSIGNYSQEICGGPHVKSTGTIGPIKIFKQKASSQGVRRLYAKLAS